MSGHTLSNSSRKSSRSNRSNRSNRSITSDNFSKGNCTGTFLNVNLLFLFFLGMFLYMSIKTPMFPNITQTKKAFLDRLVNTLSSEKKKLI